MQNDLLKSPILKTILGMAFPMSWGIFSVIGFNIADTYFIGKLGKIYLAAITLTFPIIMTYFSLILGLSTSINSIVSRYIGGNETHKAKRMITHSLLLSVIVAGIFLILGFCFLEKILILLGANESTLPLAIDYMEIWLMGMIFITVPIVGNGALRGLGDMKVAASIMMIAAISNIILDPILIFGFGDFDGLGIKGAAYATVIARSLTFIASLYILFFKYKMIDLKIPSYESFKADTFKILKISVPVSFTNFLAPLSMLTATYYISRIGNEEIAAYGVTNRIESFALIVIIAISSAVGPFVGQNYGAQKIDRIEKAVISSFLLSHIWAVIISFVIGQFALRIMGIFNSDLEVINLGAEFLMIVPITYGFLGMKLMAGSFFNAIGRPLLGTCLGIGHFVLLFIPFLLIGNFYFGITGVFYAHAISNFIIGLISYLMIKYYVQNYMD